jgi:hypothetical protein
MDADIEQVTRHTFQNSLNSLVKILIFKRNLNGTKPILFWKDSFLLITGIVFDYTLPVR